MFSEKDAGPGIAVSALEPDDCVISLVNNRSNRFATVLSNSYFASGVHTCEFTVLACNPKEGGIFVGLAPAICRLDGALTDPSCGCGWGKGTPHFAWIEVAGTPTGTLTWMPAVPARGAMTSPYPYYLRRDQPNLERRHHLFQLDPQQVSLLLAKWGQRHHAAALRRAGIDGVALQALTAADLAALGVRCPVETQILLANIRRHFQEELSYSQGAHRCQSRANTSSSSNLLAAAWGLPGDVGRCR